MRGTSNVESVVERFIAGGAAPGQLVVGLPFYARGWKGVENVNSGLFQKARGTVGASYSAFKSEYEPVSRKFHHPETRTPYLYNPQTGVFLSYEAPQLAREQAAYAVKHNLGCAIIWELKSADANSPL